jgi:hypothetical protein
LPSPQPKQDANEIQQLKNQKAATEKMTLTTYVDLIAIGQSPEQE